jgi:hypothetical protein
VLHGPPISLLDLIILIILGEEFKSRSSSLCSFLHSPYHVENTQPYGPVQPLTGTVLAYENVQYRGSVAFMIGWLISMELMVEWEVARERWVLGGNVPQCRFVHHKFAGIGHMSLGWEPEETVWVTLWAASVPLSELPLPVSPSCECSKYFEVVEWGWSGEGAVRDPKPLVTSELLCPQLQQGLWNQEKNVASLVCFRWYSRGGDR